MSLKNYLLLILALLCGQRIFAMDEEKINNAKSLITTIHANQPGAHDTVVKILKKPVDVNYMYHELKTTPLRAAISANQLETAELLIKAGALVQPAASELSPLGAAAAYGYIPFIKLFLERGAKIDAVDISGVCPVVIAAEQKKSEALKCLLAAGGNVNAKRPDGCSMLFHALYTKSNVIVQILLEHGASPSEHDSDNYSPLDIAAAQGNLTALELLRQHGAHPNAGNIRGSTAAHMAAFHGKIKVFDALHQQCPELLNVQDYVGRTPFYWAAQQGKLEMVEHLLDLNVDLSVTFINGQTLLEWLKSAPELKAVQDLYARKIKQQKNANAKRAPKEKKKKKNKSKRTFNQRHEDDQPIVIKPTERVIETVRKLTPHERAQALNNILVSSDDHSHAIYHDGHEIVFCYGESAPTDSIYCLRHNNAESGPRLQYHANVLTTRKRFHVGERDLTTTLQVQPEALERMHGHAIPSKLKTSQGNTVSAKLFFGKKLLGGTWENGIYVLGFAQIRGEYQCFYSKFKVTPFSQILSDSQLSITDVEKEIFDKTLRTLL